ncbi:MAG: AI-2E family transporter [Bacteroidota bacterium]
MPSWVRRAVLGLRLLFSLWVFWRILDIVLLVMAALLLAVTLAPLYRWLRHRIPDSLAAFLCILSLGGGVLGFFAYLIPVFLFQGRDLLAHAPLWAARLHPLGESLFRSLGSSAGSWLSESLSWTGRFLEFFFNLAGALFLTFFFLKDRKFLLSQLLGLFPAPTQERIPPVLTAISERVGGYVLGKLLIMASVGLTVGIGLALLRVPFAALLGISYGLLDVIPYLGPATATIPGLAIAFAQSPRTGLGASLVYFLAHSLEAYLIGPIIIGRTAGIHPVWAFLALLVGARFAGLMGIILAIPAAAVLQVILDEARKNSRPS